MPAGTPFGLIGTSSLYKRESYPNGVVPAGSVTATGDPYAVFPTRVVTNWTLQGADAGLYSNSDIHAIRIVAMEPPSMPRTLGKFVNPAGERFRILGEFPVRHFEVRRTASSRSIRTAIPTPASSPRSPPTWPGPSRRSTSTAWC